MAQEPTHDAPVGPLPTVHDEAADTPTWLPVVGLVLFVAMLLGMLYRATHPEPEAAPEATAAAAEVEAGDGAPAEAPAGE